MIVTVTWLVVAASALTVYLYRVYTKLSRRGVNHVPVVPFFGHLFWILIKKEYVVDTFMKSINAFPEDRFVGHYDLTTPSIVVKDLETIKRITTKDFEHFVDRRGFSNEQEPMFGRGLVMLKGDEWKAMRSTLSSAFTSSKICLMVPFMLEVGEKMIKVLNEKIRCSENSYIDLEVKDLATRYANDVIASCAFGLKVDSQSEDNLFYTMTKDITSFPFTRILKMILFRASPRISEEKFQVWGDVIHLPKMYMQMLNLKLIPQQTTDFFTDVVLGTMKNRERLNIVRNDMINILMEVKKGQLAHEHDAVDTDAGFATVEESSIGKKKHDFEWTDTDLVAQAVLFLFAGFETVSTTMAFIVQELAMNPEVQEKLAQEIREHDAKNDGHCDYNSIQSMTYLDMVISEGLRLWPAGDFMDRSCVKDYNIGRANSTATEDYIVRKGEYIVYPIWAFHRDPKLFPNPTKFNPERFAPENRDKIKPFSYMPFGMGPRNCIGSRFALCELKVMLYQLLRVMELSPFEKTSIPIELSTDSFNLMIKGGAWIRFRLRTQ